MELLLLIDTIYFVTSFKVIVMAGYPACKLCSCIVHIDVSVSCKS